MWKLAWKQTNEDVRMYIEELYSSSISCSLYTSVGGSVMMIRIEFTSIYIIP